MRRKAIEDGLAGANYSLAEKGAGGGLKRDVHPGRLHDGGTGGGHLGLSGGDSLRAERAEPAGGEPGARDGKLRPSTVKTDANVRRRRHGGVTQRTRAVAIKPYFRRDYRQGGRLALWANHKCTSATDENASR